MTFFLAGQVAAAGPDTQLWAVIAALVGALVFMTKAQTKTTGILVECVSASTKAATQLTSEISLQGTLTRESLKIQAQTAKNTYKGLERLIETQNCIGNECQFSNRNVEEVMDYVKAKKN